MDRTVVAPVGADQLSDSQQSFYRLLAIFVVAGAAASMLAFHVMGRSIDGQRANIALLEGEVSKLDAQIKEIGALESNLKVLRDRQNAVESLQAMRNAPVRMMSALLQSTPETVVLSAVKQVGNRLTISGLAPSNGDIAQFLKNLENMPTRFDHPELVESVAPEQLAQAGQVRMPLTFSIRVDLAAGAAAAVSKPG